MLSLVTSLSERTGLVIGHELIFGHSQITDQDLDLDRNPLDLDSDCQTDQRLA